MNKIGRSFTWKKLLGIGGLILLLQFPVYQIEDLTTEREDLQKKESSSAIQKIYEPVISVPITTSNFDPAGNRLTSEKEDVFIVPESSNIKINIDAKELKRGLYKFADYQSEIIIETKVFKKEPTPVYDKGKVVSEIEYNWNEAKLLIGFEKAPELSGQPVLKINSEEKLEEYKRSTLKLSDARYVFEVPIILAQNGTDFSTSFKLKDKDVLDVRSFAKSSLIKMESNWLTPGFRGQTPESRKLTDQGFMSKWSTYNYEDNNCYVKSLASRGRDNGVMLYNGIDHYRLVYRVLRFQLLFFFVIFVTFILVEVIQRMPVHPIQYLLIGAAICLFYLLLLSFSERIGFAFAYLIGSLVSCGLIALYTAAILKSWKNGLNILLISGSSYGALYILLQSEDTLLLGTLALTALLSVIMYRSRNIDWYGLDKTNNN